jgi:hypothetical protein
VDETKNAVKVILMYLGACEKDGRKRGLWGLFSESLSTQKLDKSTTHMSTLMIYLYLMGVYLTGVYLMGVCLFGVYLTGVHLTGMCLMGMHLIGVHLIDAYFMDMYMFPNPKRLWEKPPDPSFYKRWSICRDLSCKIR